MQANVEHVGWIRQESRSWPWGAGESLGEETPEPHGGGHCGVAKQAGPGPAGTLRSHEKHLSSPVPQ